MSFLSRFKAKREASITYASQNYVEQLRTVHFALLSVSAGLLLLVLSIKPYDPQKAIVQLEGIMRLQGIWNPNDLVGYSSPPDHIEIASRSPDHSIGDSLNVKLGSPHENPLVLPVRKPQLPTDFIWANHLVGGFPDTLDNFAEWWTDLGRTTHTFIDMKTLRIRPNCDAKGFQQCGIVRSDNSISPNDSNVQLVLDTQNPDIFPPKVGGDVRLQQIDGNTINATRNVSVVVFVSSYWQSTILQSNVVKLSAAARAGEFESSFPDLGRATAGPIRSLPFGEILKHLNAEGAAGEVFETFGLKIQSEQVTSWGTVIILCIQLYLFMYLRGLKRPLEQSDDSWSVGWFAVNEGLLPRSIFFVTVWVLPVVTVSLLATHALGQRLQLTPFRFQQGAGAISEVFTFAHDFPAVSFIILGCCISLVLGYLNWSNRPRVKVESAPSRRQLFE